VSWLVEDPTFVLIAAGLAVVGLAISFFQTGRGLYLIWIGAVLFVMLLLLLIERYVVTDREQVEETLYAAAAALEANDLEATLSYVSPTADLLQGDIRGRMRSVEFEDTEISDLAIELSPSESPPRAHASFLGRVDFKMSNLPFERIIRRVTVELTWEDDRWLVHSYKLTAPHIQP
jgi:hypothetical protein